MRVDAEPAGDVDLQVGLLRQPEQRQPPHVRPLVLGQAVEGEGQDVGAERVADQEHVGPLPGFAVVVHDQVEVGRDLLRRLLRPEVAQAVDADDRDALVLQAAGDLLVDVAPAAVAGVDDRHQLAGLGHRQLDQRQAGQRLGRGGGERRLQQLAQAGAEIAAGVGRDHGIGGRTGGVGEGPRASPRSAGVAATRHQPGRGGRPVLEAAAGRRAWTGAPAQSGVLVAIRVVKPSLAAPARVASGAWARAA